MNGITYDSVNNTITVAYDAGDGTRGASFSDPYNFQDIYDKSVASGWGVISLLEDSYFMQAKLILSGSDTYFKETSKTIMTQPLEEDIFLQISQANVLFEKLYFKRIASVENQGRALSVAGGNSIELHSCVFEGYAAGFNLNDVKVYNCQLLGVSYIRPNVNTIIDNLTCVGGIYIFNPSSEADIKNVRIYDASSPILFTPSGEDLSLTYVGLEIFNSTTRDIYVRVHGVNSVMNLIDCVLKGVIDFYRSSGTTAADCTINIQTFMQVESSEDDVGIKVYDKDGELVFEGATLNEAITYYREVGVSESGETPTVTKTTYEPFRVVVSKSGYETVELNDVYATIEDPNNVGERVGTIDKTIIRAELKKTVDLMVAPDGNSYVKANKENLGNNRDILL